MPRQGLEFSLRGVHPVRQVGIYPGLLGLDDMGIDERDASNGEKSAILARRDGACICSQVEDEKSVARLPGIT